MVAVRWNEGLFPHHFRMVDPDSLATKFLIPTIIWRQSMDKWKKIGLFYETFLSSNCMEIVPSKFHLCSKATSAIHFSWRGRNFFSSDSFYRLLCGSSWNYIDFLLSRENERIDFFPLFIGHSKRRRGGEGIGLWSRHIKISRCRYHRTCVWIKYFMDEQWTLWTLVILSLKLTVANVLFIFLSMGKPPFEWLENIEQVELSMILNNNKQKNASHFQCKIYSNNFVLNFFSLKWNWMRNSSFAFDTWHFAVCKSSTEICNFSIIQKSFVFFLNWKVLNGIIVRLEVEIFSRPWKKRPASIGIETVFYWPLNGSRFHHATNDSDKPTSKQCDDKFMRLDWHTNSTRHTNNAYKCAYFANKISDNCFVFFVLLKKM